MALSLRSVRNAALVGVLFGIPVLLLRSSIQDPSDMNGLDRAIRGIGAPIEAGVSYAARWVGSFFERWVFQARTLEENERLEVENRDYERRLRELTLLEEENRQLRRALQMRERVPEDLLAAEVTGVEQSAFFRVVKVRIDRGVELVRPGMAVLAADGVVGRISHTTEGWSDVQLVTDPQSKIAVEIARTHDSGILVGTGEDSCTVKIQGEEPLLEGDIVQTSGADDLFPRGHQVGRVARVEKKGGAQVLEIVPSVRFDRVDAVWVVIATAPKPDPDAGRAGSRADSSGLQALQ